MLKQQLLKQLLKLKTRGFLMKGVIAIITIGVVLGACSGLNRYFGMDDDNFLEEVFEKQIENQTGLDLDLTPDSPE